MDVQEARIRTLLEVHREIAKDISEEEFHEEFDSERLEGRRTDIGIVEDMICRTAGCE